MRRKDREVVNKGDLLAILKGCPVCRLGLAVDDKPYVVPLNFGYTWEENEPLKLYFHSAREGLKLDMLTQNDLACFEIDGYHKLSVGENACGYSYVYASIIGWGRVRFLEEVEEKRRALNQLMEHQTGSGGCVFNEAALTHTTMFYLEAEEITGKRSQG